MKKPDSKRGREDPQRRDNAGLEPRLTAFRPLRSAAPLGAPVRLPDQGGAVLRGAVPLAHLVDPDPARLGPLERRVPRLRPAGEPRRGAGPRRLRGGLARLLREHLQPDAHEPGADALAHTEEILAQPARGRGDPGPDPKRRDARYHDAREGADHADETKARSGAR